MQNPHNPGKLRVTSEHTDSAEVSSDAVREELQRVLASREFRTSRRSQEFLRYVVETTLSGAGDSLKERTIGIEVFGRPTSYEPNEDATVRVKASEVRRRLGQYYGSTVGDPVVIDLPLGTYVPEFHPASSETNVQQSELEPAERRRRFSRWVWLAGFIIALGGGAVYYESWSHRAMGTSSTAFEEFWAPVLNERKPVSLCVVVVPVYSQMQEPRPGGKPSGDDFKLVPDQFVAVGDLSSVLQLSEMFARLNHPYRMRVGKDVSFRDIRSSPAVLVGFSYTKWDEISRGFRYFIDMDHRPVAILDNGQPTNWMISGHPDDPALREDYAIVSRVFDSDTHNILIEISGISHYGTEAATDFVANPALLTEAFRDAPKGWQDKNAQIVLHVNIIGGAPGVANVLATHYW